MESALVYITECNPIDEEDVRFVSSLKKDRVFVFFKSREYNYDLEKMCSLALKGYKEVHSFPYQEDKEILGLLLSLQKENPSISFQIFKRDNQIKEKVFFDCPILVLFYIADNKMYYCQELSSMMKDSRYAHSVSVAKTAYEIALKNHYPHPLKAYEAGLFHDCGKDIDVSLQREITASYYKEAMPCPDYALHQFVSAYYAKIKFNIQDEEILSAISSHCLGKGKMAELDKIVYCADKVEPTRIFDTEEDREACFKNIDEGFLKVLKSQVSFFRKKQINFIDHPLSEAMYKNYLGENYVKETRKENNEAGR